MVRDPAGYLEKVMDRVAIARPGDQVFEEAVARGDVMCDHFLPAELLERTPIDSWCVPTVYNAFRTADNPETVRVCLTVTCELTEVDTALVYMNAALGWLDNFART